MQSIEEFDFFPLGFEGDGKLEQPQQLAELRNAVQSTGISDLIFLVHGFRSGTTDATALYTEFLKTLRVHMGRPEFRGGLTGRKFAVGGVYWPSLALREDYVHPDGGAMAVDPPLQELEAARAQIEEWKNAGMSPEDNSKLDQAIALLPRVEDDPSAQDRFVTLLLSVVKEGDRDPTEGLSQIRSKSGSEIFEKLSLPIIVPTQPRADEGGLMEEGGQFVAGMDGETQSVGSFFQSIGGRACQFLNLTTWYLMKERSGTVGFTGLSEAVRDIGAAAPNVKIHLAGHSLGGRLLAACAKSLAEVPRLQVDSLTLLEPAFSHYGFSPNNGEGTPGFFRAVVEKQVVKGPFVSTFSYQDTVVGRVYAIASRLADDNTKAVGDADDPFGGLGRNGAQKTPESAVMALHAPGSAYAFQPGTVNCLDGSGGWIKSHGDITNENVTYAFASVLASS